MGHTVGFAKRSRSRTAAEPSFATSTDENTILAESLRPPVQNSSVTLNPKLKCLAWDISVRSAFVGSAHTHCEAGELAAVPEATSVDVYILVLRQRWHSTVTLLMSCSAGFVIPWTLLIETSTPSPSDWQYSCRSAFFWADEFPRVLSIKVAGRGMQCNGECYGKFQASAVRAVTTQRVEEQTMALQSRSEGESP